MSLVYFYCNIIFVKIGRKSYWSWTEVKIIALKIAFYYNVALIQGIF